MLYDDLFGRWGPLIIIVIGVVIILIALLIFACFLTPGCVGYECFRKRGKTIAALIALHRARARNRWSDALQFSRSAGELKFQARGLDILLCKRDSSSRIYRRFNRRFRGARARRRENARPVYAISRLVIFQSRM